MAPPGFSLDGVATDSETRGVSTLSPHYRLLDSVRDTRKTLYFVAGTYVTIGLLLAVFTAMSGNLMGTVVGFVIISGALFAATLFRTLTKVGLRVSAMGEHLDEVRQHLGQLQEVSSLGLGASEAGSERQVIDLGRNAHGDPSLITAATLRRTTYPRLASSVDDRSPAESESGSSDRADLPEVMGTSYVGEVSDVAASREHDPLRTWQDALKSGDYATCRAMYAILVDTVEPRVVVELGEQIEALARRTEEALRLRFRACVRGRDFDGALNVGRDILRLMPDRSVADEYRHLEPHVLRRRAERHIEEEPALRIAH